MTKEGNARAIFWTYVFIAGAIIGACIIAVKLFHS